MSRAGPIRLLLLFLFAYVFTAIFFGQAHAHNCLQWIQQGVLNSPDCANTNTANVAASVGTLASIGGLGAMGLAGVGPLAGLLGGQGEVGISGAPGVVGVPGPTDGGSPGTGTLLGTTEEANEIKRLRIVDEVTKIVEALGDSRLSPQGRQALLDRLNAVTKDYPLQPRPDVVPVDFKPSTKSVDASDVTNEIPMSQEEFEQHMLTMIAVLATLPAALGGLRMAAQGLRAGAGRMGVGLSKQGLEEVWTYLGGGDRYGAIEGFQKMGAFPNANWELAKRLAVKERPWSEVAKALGMTWW